MFKIAGRRGFAGPAHGLVALALMLALSPLFSTPARAATPEQVDQAIEKAKAYLYSEINKSGNWELTQTPRTNDNDAKVDGGQWAGLTSIVTYSLLAADEPPTEPRLAQAIKFLESAETGGVYALGIRCQVWHLLGGSRPDVQSPLKRDASLLYQGVNPTTGLYDYGVSSKGERSDHSVSQYGVLGLWACEQENIEIPGKYWETLDAGWRRDQHADGSWSYDRKGKDSKGTATMTAAGVATLFITQDELGKLKPLSGCAPWSADPHIEKGLKWMGDHFDEVFQGNRANYCLYGVERIGVASGHKYFGTTDWYKTGADWLIKEQDPKTGGFGGVPDTCFALLFMVHGRAPVCFQKLQYDGDWNQRPRDLANVTAWIGKETELHRFLNWQIVDLSAPVDDLHEAPIMYISGDKPLAFTEPEEQKLKQFVQDGGLLVFNTDCGKADNAFALSAEKLSMKLFPESREFEQIKPDHPLFADSNYRAWKTKPVIRGLNNGVRELVLIIPTADPSRAWQAQAFQSQKESFQLGQALLFYCIDPTNLGDKGRSYIVRADPAIKATRTLKVARLMHNGNPDPEPAGWRRMAGVIHNRHQMDLEITSVTPAAGALKDYKIAALTGTDAFNISAEGWKEIKRFVDEGGTLIVDAAGGAKEFDDAAQKALAGVFAEGATGLGTPLPPDHLLYKQIDQPLSVLQYRPYARKFHASLRNPLICGIPVGDRIGVFYSAMDLSAGLVGEERNGIDGYSPSTATSLVEHMILYAESGGKPVAIAPPPEAHHDDPSPSKHNKHKK